MSLFHRKPLESRQDWLLPRGSYPSLCANMLTQPHILIAGATGSGKSVLLNAFVYSALYSSPRRSFVLIDPKRVELVMYRRLPHTIRYASEPDDILAVLQETVMQMDKRYKLMQAAGQKKSPLCEVYIIIDEFADLMTTQKKTVLPLLCRIAQLGRAANIHLVAATQRPTRDIINGQIKVNMDSRIALRVPTAQDSRNIIDMAGAEALPRYGKGYYLTPETMQPVQIDIPFVPETEIMRLVRHWESQAVGYQPSWDTYKV